MSVQGTSCLSFADPKADPRQTLVELVTTRFSAGLGMLRGSGDTISDVPGA